MKDLLGKLQGLSFVDQAFFFLAENILLSLLALALGNLLLRKFHQPVHKVSNYEWGITAVTVIINTVVTIAGYKLWLLELIRIDFSFSIRILFDFLFLFMAMDLLMYMFHLLIHRTFLNQYIHDLHHKSINPTPIDLFVLHPLETLAFGSLWLSLLMTCKLNIFGILAYLTINVIFGIIGHLGFEPLSKPGMSSFRHHHHADETCNFGFYTSIWDRMFGTFKQ